VEGSQGQALFGSSSSSAAPPPSSAPLSAPQPPSFGAPASSGVSSAWLSAFAPSSSATQAQQPAAQPPQLPPPSFDDDFDSGFDDLAEANAADDKGEEDFGFGSHHRDGLDEFNPVFDSPVASKVNTLGSQQTPTGNNASFDDFDQHFAQSFPQPKAAPQQPAANTSHDWDAIFSRLDSPSAAAAPGEAGRSPFPEPTTSSTAGASRGPAAGVSAPSMGAAEMPQLGRALTTEHDDPILKNLTSMGYPREDALAALEKFDYDIDKVCSDCRVTQSVDEWALRAESAENMKTHIH